MKKTILYLLLILFLSCTVVSAKTIVMTFSATGLSPGGVFGNEAPDDPVSGSITWEADSVNSPITSLTSIDLTIDGFSYTIEDVTFDVVFNYFVNENVNVLGGKLNSANSVNSEEGDDFAITWTISSLVPVDFVYATSNLNDIFEASGFIEFHIEAALDPDPGSEREALIALYNSTNGRKWSDNTGWLGEPGTECSWSGITCNVFGNVVGIYLSNNRITGSIPPAIGKLSSLETLSISDNQLTGELPREIGNLGNLEYIYLLNNQLTGKIPPEIGNLKSLQGLYLGGNYLTGDIPPEIGGMGNLIILSLGWNELTGDIPPEIGNLKSLQGLYLGGNYLTGDIPAEFRNLINLYYLYLHNNQLTGEIPPEMGNFLNLQVLNLSGNFLYGIIPPEFTNLINLRLFDISNNCITGDFSAVSHVTEVYGKLDKDSDNDEIGDSCDVCPLDPENDCSIEDICECNADWKNQRKYIECIARTTKDFMTFGLISKDERKLIQDEAEESLCGTRN